MGTPNIAQDDITTNVQGFYTLQNEEHEKKDTKDALSHDHTRHTRDKLCMLYAKAAKWQDINFQNYCRHVCNLNTNQCYIVNVQYSMVQELHKCSKTWRKPKRIQNFLGGLGRQGKVMLYISYKETCLIFQTHSET